MAPWSLKSAYYGRKMSNLWLKSESFVRLALANWLHKKAVVESCLFFVALLNRSEKNPDSREKITTNIDLTLRLSVV